ncbi:hypothetical protein [Micromonospora inositola]|uniref:Uncharacterized protein n=1 Tax=Micromonospora inositola TaxID=47865 RepID=A0A1C5IRX6_9ACTN|nr:hypothetical protein [Micromonospora inositola]SCG61118.1 hypothetical protein GA0070613_3350 [Micromonospora inositola]
MELHRNRGPLVLAAVCVVGGVTVLAVGGASRFLSTLVAVGAAVLGGVVLLGALRPFRFAIGPDGLDVRRPGLRGTYRWEQFDALALADGPPVQGRPGTPRLLGVPGAALPPEVRATARHPVDGRAAVELLDLVQVRQSADEVAAALARHAGDRFTDTRTRVAARLVGTDLDFTESLRGYRTERIDELVRRAQVALAHGDAVARQAARSEIEQARAAGLPVALRGYSVLQVDVALDALCAALADPAANDRKTAL